MFSSFQAPRAWGRAGLTASAPAPDVDPDGNPVPVYPAYTQFGMDASNTNSYPGTGSSVYTLDENGAVVQTGTLNSTTFTTVDSIPAFYFNGSATTTMNDNTGTPITYPQFDFTSQVSFNFWVKLDAKLTIHTLFGNAYAGGTQDGFKVNVNGWNSGGNGNINMEMGNGSSGSVIYTANGVVTQDGTTWHMLTYALSFPDSVNRMWVDGVELATTGTAIADANMNRAWAIGSMVSGSSYAYGMRGYLSQMQFWGGLLTSTEVQTLYNDSKSRYPGH